MHVCINVRMYVLKYVACMYVFMYVFKYARMHIVLYYVFNYYLRICTFGRDKPTTGTGTWIEEVYCMQHCESVPLGCSN